MLNKSKLWFIGLVSGASLLQLGSGCGAGDWLPHDFWASFLGGALETTRDLLIDNVL